MPIGLTARQKADLAAMLPNIEESVASLKRLITDAKDRTRALTRLTEAEEAQKRHARDVGVPFNAEAFAARRAELESLPKELTVEDGQLAAFVSLQRAIGVVVEGPYVREARGGKAGKGKAAGRVGRQPARGAKRGEPRAAQKPAGKGAAKKPAGRGGAKTGPRLVKSGAPAVPAPAPMKRVKPLPLALGS